MADEVLVGHGDRIGIIMINRPQARNAISANGKLEPWVVLPETSISTVHRR